MAVGSSFLELATQHNTPPEEQKILLQNAQHCYEEIIFAIEKGQFESLAQRITNLTSPEQIPELESLSQSGRILSLVRLTNLFCQSHQFHNAYEVVDAILRTPEWENSLAETPQIKFSFLFNAITTLQEVGDDHWKELYTQIEDQIEIFPPIFYLPFLQLKLLNTAWVVEPNNQNEAISLLDALEGMQKTLNPGNSEAIALLIQPALAAIHAEILQRFSKKNTPEYKQIKERWETNYRNKDIHPLLLTIHTEQYGHVLEAELRTQENKNPDQLQEIEALYSQENKLQYHRSQIKLEEILNKPFPKNPETIEVLKQEILEIMTILQKHIPWDIFEKLRRQQNAPSPTAQGINNRVQATLGTPITTNQTEQPWPFLETIQALVKKFWDQDISAAQADFFIESAGKRQERLFQTLKNATTPSPQPNTIKEFLKNAALPIHTVSLQKDTDPKQLHADYDHAQSTGKSSGTAVIVEKNLILYKSDQASVSTFPEVLYIPFKGQYLVLVFEQELEPFQRQVLANYFFQFEEFTGNKTTRLIDLSSEKNPEIFFPQWHLSADPDSQKTLPTIVMELNYQTLYQQKDWTEIPKELDLSAKGPHLVTFSTTKQSNGRVTKQVLAASKILDLSSNIAKQHQQPDKLRDNLFLRDFFQTNVLDTRTKINPKQKKAIAEFLAPNTPKEFWDHIDSYDDLLQKMHQTDAMKTHEWVRFTLESSGRKILVDLFREFHEACTTMQEHGTAYLLPITNKQDLIFSMVKALEKNHGRPLKMVLGEQTNQKGETLNLTLVDTAASSEIMGNYSEAKIKKLMIKVFKESRN